MTPRKVNRLFDEGEEDDVHNGIIVVFVAVSVGVSVSTVVADAVVVIVVVVVVVVMAGELLPRVSGAVFNGE